MIIWILGLAACQESGETVQTRDIEARLSPVEFEWNQGENPPVTVRLAEVRPATDPETRHQARARLEALIHDAGETLSLESPGAQTDRYQRRIAHVYAESSDSQVWFQGVLVSEGWLIVSSYSDNHTHAATLLALENEARTHQRGGWASGAFEVLHTDPNTLAQHLDSFQIVEGRIIDVSPIINDQIFLNFGFDWRSDFTVVIPQDALERFEGLDVTSLEGHQVRVRGWLQQSNGPMIRIDHREALELITQPERASLP